MERADENTTPAACLKRSAFTCSAVYADESVRGLEKPLRVSHVDMKAAVRSLEDLREDEQGKLAVLVQLDGKVDKVVNEFVGRLLLLVNKNYDDPLYRRYVPGSVRDITQADMRTQEPLLVADIVKLLGEDQAKPGIGALATEFVSQLQAANDAVISAEKDLAQTEAEANHLDKKTLPALVATWSDEYVKLHAALTAAWPKDPDRVERCFKPFRKPSKKPKPAAAPNAPVSPSGPSAAAPPAAPAAGATGSGGG